MSLHILNNLPQLQVSFTQETDIAGDKLQHILTTSHNTRQKMIHMVTSHQLSHKEDATWDITHNKTLDTIETKPLKDGKTDEK